MRQWVLYVGVLGFGLIWIAMGIGLRTPDSWSASLGFVLLGALFAFLGLGGLLFGTPAEQLPPNGAESHQLIAMGSVLIAAGVIGAASIAVYYPFKGPQMEGQAPWIGWVFFAALSWFALAGIAMIFYGWKQPR